MGTIKVTYYYPENNRVVEVFVSVEEDERAKNGRDYFLEKQFYKHHLEMHLFRYYIQIH